MECYISALQQGTTGLCAPIGFLLGLNVSLSIFDIEAMRSTRADHQMLVD